MSVKIKKIIREELSRMIEGDVVRPKFGSAPKPRAQSDLQAALGRVKGMIEDMINNEGSEMEDDTVVALSELLDHVEELHDKAAGGPASDDETPYGGPASGGERSELERFKSYMRDRDRDRDY
jgi:hypothetical protein